MQTRSAGGRWTPVWWLLVVVAAVFVYLCYVLVFPERF
jgi:K+-transporting ATPase KdpF subunit